MVYNVKLVLAACLVAVCLVSFAQGSHHVEYTHHPKYEFKYAVHDHKTGDMKSHSEHRDGDKVKGYYALKEADGTIRHVHYSADKHNGFTAHVTKTGHSHHHY